MTRIERLPNASAFLAAVEPLLLASEAENAFILTFAERLVSGEVSAPRPYFAVARDGRGVSLCALGAREGSIALTRADEARAIELLADDVCSARPETDAVFGPEPTATAFARALAARSGGQATLHTGERLHVATAVRAPATLARGALRLATLDDLAVLVRFTIDFLAEIGEAGDAERDERERITRGARYVWDDEGPVAMAGIARKTPSGIAVNHVYTPEALRGRGYASACVATLTQQLLDAGNRFVCLYTDVANPVSNALYAKLGYEPVSDAGNHRVSRGVLNAP